MNSQSRFYGISIILLVAASMLLQFNPMQMLHFSNSTISTSTSSTSTSSTSSTSSTPTTSSTINTTSSTSTLSSTTTLLPVNTLFAESGLPQGAPWNLTYGGKISSSSSNSVLFSTLPGNYPLVISNQSYNGITYSAAPYPANFVAGNSLLILFAPNAVRTTTTTSTSTSTSTAPTTLLMVSTLFTESGLPSGLMWDVSYARGTNSSTTNSVLFSTLPGNYPLTVPNQSDNGIIYSAVYPQSLAAGNQLAIYFTPNQLPSTTTSTISTTSTSTSTSSTSSSSSLTTTIGALNTSSLLNSTQQIYQLNSSFNMTALHKFSASGQILVGNATAGSPLSLSYAQMSNLTSLNSTQLGSISRIFKPVLGKNISRQVVAYNATISVPFGRVKQGRGYVKAGTKLRFATYSQNHTFSLYNVTIARAVPSLLISVAGATISRPNVTQTIHVPILPGQKTYNVSIALSSAINGTDSLNYTYSVKKTDLKKASTVLLVQSASAGNGLARSIRFTSVPTNQSLQVTFDAQGDSNYTSVDPTANIIPVNIVFYVPITITNSQTSATAQPFQQLVTVNSLKYQAYETNNLDNIEFFYPNGILVTSWLEGNTYNQANVVTFGDTSDDYYLSVNQLGATGTGTASENVLMGFATTGTNLFDGITVGEAPNRSFQSFGTYGLYDTGSAVFPYYTSFGNSLSALPSGWLLSHSSGAGVFTAANYVIGATGTWGGITSNILFPIRGNVFNVAMTLPSSTSKDVAVFGVGNSLVHVTAYFTHAGTGSKGCDTVIGGACTGSFSTSSNAGAAIGFFGRITVASGALTQTSSTTFITANTYPTGTAEVYGIGFDPTTTTTYFYEKNIQSNTLSVLPGTTTLPISLVANITGVSVDWVRIRSLPPSGVMPAVSFGTSVQGALTFNEFGLPSSTPLLSATSLQPRELMTSRQLQ
ncbi:MAG: hypothetical protein KGH61_03455 [Candidatus Micrarchaeota archaeon]|nr:hypothetical protein [Candidatus Micrarchaeota archaeon]MDE1847979.1 hypothetical protein [Candidatus Micrarchaeota archaeon]MDE1864678.1 hypothetical protein [Candidatus Micrarchaeota archaeon]